MSDVKGTHECPPPLYDEPHFVLKVYPSGRIAWGDGRALTLAQLIALKMLAEGQHSTVAAAGAFASAAAPEAI